MSQSYFPPVLSPEAAEAETVRRAQRDLDTLMTVASARGRAKPITTISTPATPSVLGVPFPPCMSCDEPATCEVEEDGEFAPVCHSCGEAYRALRRERR